MTVICWDGHTLAADRRCVSGGLICTITKIARFGDLLAGAAGESAACNEAMYWVSNGRVPQEYPAMQRDEDDYASLLVIDNGKILKYGRSPIPTVVDDNIIAIGSGREIALTAMHLGKTAKEAVEITSLLMCDCGNGVDCLTLEGE